MDNEEVFVDFYRQHVRLVYTVAHQRLGSIDLAQDVTSEVFRIAWTHHRNHGEVTMPWVYRVLRNVIGDEYRRQKRAADLAAQLELQEPVEYVEDFDTEVWDVRQALTLLSSSDQDLMRMAFWEDLTHKEIAQLLGVTAATIRVRLFRAKRRFRSVLEHHGLARTSTKGLSDG